MKLDQLRDLASDDEAVSPVIGVILMVAITVILAAVIGTFVLGLGNQVTGSTAPTADFSFDYNPGGSDKVKVTHNGGDAIDDTLVNVTYGGNTDDATSWGGSDDQITAGESFTTSSSVSADTTVRVVWQSEGGGSSQTIASFTTPS